MRTFLQRLVVPMVVQPAPAPAIPSGLRREACRVSAQLPAAFMLLRQPLESRRLAARPAQAGAAISSGSPAARQKPKTRHWALATACWLLAGPKEALAALPDTVISDLPMLVQEPSSLLLLGVGLVLLGLLSRITRRR